MKNAQIPPAPAVRAEIPPTHVPAEAVTDEPAARPRLTQDILPWLTSLTVHAAIVVFGVMTATVIMAPPPPTMQEQIGSAETTVHQDNMTLPQVFDKKPMPTIGESEGQDKLVDAADGISRRPGNKFDVDAGGGQNDEGPVASRIAIGARQFSPGTGGSGSGTKDGDGDGDGGPPARFDPLGRSTIGGSAIFVPPVPARRIVFVCDATGTMIQKLGDLKHELTKAVAALRPNQSFNIIFFTDGGKYHIAEKNGLVVATPDNTRLAYSFLEDITPTGTTDPLPAIDAAFKQRPDLVYFLSDGEFNNLRPYEDVVRQFDSSNKERRCRVSTILFETYDREAEQVMQRIAGEHGGNYRYIRSEDLR